MAKFLISNCIRDIESNIRRVSPFFSKFTRNEVMGVYSVCYEKEINSFGNTYRENDDFCIVVGTCIYDNKTGIDAAKQIFDDFECEQSIAKIKKSSVGLYAVYIKKNNNLFVFNDYYGLYDVCYYSKHDKYVIGNSLKDVAQTLQTLQISDYDLLMQVFYVGCFPGKTIFMDVFKLKGNEYLCVTGIEITIQSIEQNEYQIQYSFTNEDDALRDISKWLCDYAFLVDQLFKTETVFLTGGLDSRLVFGTFKNVKANFTCCYGEGRGMEMSDKKLAEDLCRYFDINLNVLNWSHPEERSPIDWAYQQLVFDKIGFSNYISGGSKNQYESLKRMCDKHNFMAFGYFCEALRLRDYAADLKNSTFSLDEYIKDYYLNPKIPVEVFPDKEGFYNYLKSNYVKQLNSIGIVDDYGHISIDYFERFRWVQSKFCDSRMEFYINNYTYSFSLLSVPQIHEAILSLPADIIKDGVFQVKLINCLDKRLTTKFDVFSHMRLFHINKKYKKVKRLTLKNVGDELFRVLPIVKPLILKLFRKCRYNSDKVESTLNKQIRLLTQDKIGSIDFNNSNSNLYIIRQHLIGINTLRNEIYLHKNPQGRD